MTLNNSNSNSAPRRKLGRPAKEIDPTILQVGRVDTYSRMSELTGVERDRRILWERQRKQRQKAARQRSMTPNAPVGEDLLARYHAAQAEVRIAYDLLSAERRRSAELERQLALGGREPSRGAR